MDFHETFSIDSLLKEDELKRYSRVKGQGHMGSTLKIVLGAKSPEPLNDFHVTFTIDSLPKED